MNTMLVTGAISVIGYWNMVLQKIKHIIEG
jgi:hypothetical protein